MARQRRGNLPVSDPHAEPPIPRGSTRAPGTPLRIFVGDQGSPESEQPPSDELLRRQRDEVLRLQRKVEDEIQSILQDLAPTRNEAKKRRRS